MKRVLLAEDDPFIIDIYASQLKSDGYTIDIAKDGEMALEKIKNTHPDILLLDITMPKITGWELLKLVRSDSSIKDLKVIIISNLDHDECVSIGTGLGVLKCFLKVQTTPEEISKAIKEILN